MGTLKRTENIMNFKRVLKIVYVTVISRCPFNQILSDLKMYQGSEQHIVNGKKNGMYRITPKYTIVMWQWLQI